MKTIKECWNVENKSPRESQNIAFDFLQDNIKKKYIFIEAPPGSGKSLISYMFSQYFKQDPAYKSSFILTHQKILQEQYANEFSDIVSFYGKGNYKCKAHNTDCATGNLLNKAKHEKCEKCPADIMKLKAIKSDVTVMNYTLALKSFLYTDNFEKRNLMVFDECHTLESILVDFQSVEIVKATCEKHHIKFSFSDDIKKVYKWLKDTYYPSMDITYNKLKEEYYYLDGKNSKELSKEELSTLKYIDSLEGHLALLSEFLDQPLETIEKNYIIVHENDNLKIKYVYGSHNFHTILKPKADKFLFMSATIFDYQEMCRSFNIPLEEACFLSLDSEFHVDNRPIFYHPVVKMSYGWEKNEQAKKELVETIKHILIEHKDQNGVIHTGNYMVARWLVEHLEDKIKHDIYHHNGSTDSRDDCISSFLKSKKPSIIISPSVTEGLDLKDDLGRFGIIAKLPYLQLQDLWVKKRMELDKSWYSNCCCKTIIQSSGRVVRHSNDFGVNYILDENFENLLKYNSKRFPKWWIDSVEHL